MDRGEIEALLALPLAELLNRADTVRHNEAGDDIELCNIMNAKSGRCGEDCKFCAQSARHATGAAEYPLKSRAEMLQAARQAKEIGAARFDIVTSGNRLTDDEIARVAEAVSEITSTVGIAMCASLGRLGEKSLTLLKQAGLSRYHHNIETSPAFYPRVVTTHRFEERIETIRAAKRAGLEVCSGGIIGLGESWADRIEMALLLKELGVTSVPINLLVRIPGTPFESLAPISCVDAIRTIALFRCVLRDRIIKIAAGRESVLKDFQAMAFMAGANGMLIGGYLTLRGREAQEDRGLLEEVKKAWRR
jgi:biotin synthase